jgi:hypothetical protein
MDPPPLVMDIQARGRLRAEPLGCCNRLEGPLTHRLFHSSLLLKQRMPAGPFGAGSKAFRTSALPMADSRRGERKKTPVA